MPFYIYSNWICDLASKINGFKVDGIEFIPFIIILRKGVSLSLKNHETIHFYQMMECYIIFYYIIYAINYAILRFKGVDHINAYKNIVFEKEAYNNQNKKNYLKTRKLWSWRKYL